MKKCFISLVIILVLAVSEGAAQNLPDTGFPFVSQLKAEPRNNLIRLTWADSPDALGPVYIFRSIRPFAGTIPPNSIPLVVPYGTRQYIDDLDAMESLHYFFAASDAGGKRYDIILPGINTTSVNLADTAGVRLTDADTDTIDYLEDFFPDTGSIQAISNLRASQDRERVIITYELSGAPKNVVLYRSVLPVRQPHDLLNATIVQSGIESPFEDFPPPGLTWYYAAFYEDEISGGNMDIRLGSNTTVAAVVISGTDTQERSIRSIPLPYMTVQNAVPGSDFFWAIPGQVPLNPETAKALEDASAMPKVPFTPKKPRVFAVDLKPPPGGEESALVQIVHDYFEKREWVNARNSLLNYLSLPRSKNVEARARFYLGQTWYFTGNYREALFEFLSIQPLHPVEANTWIDATLTAMTY